MWFGLESEMKAWPKAGGDFVALAETFENQRYLLTVRVAGSAPSHGAVAHADSLDPIWPRPISRRALSLRPYRCALTSRNGPTSSFRQTRRRSRTAAARTRSARRTSSCRTAGSGAATGTSTRPCRRSTSTATRTTSSSRSLRTSATSRSWASVRRPALLVHPDCPFTLLNPGSDRLWNGANAGKHLLPTDPPAYSDIAGKEDRKLDSIELPPGWVWSTPTFEVRRLTPPSSHPPPLLPPDLDRLT